MTDSKKAGPLSPRLHPTAQQVLGPFFLPDSPLKSVLYPKGAKGSRLKVSGQVLSPDCKPLAGAVVHVWVADPKGRYDNEDDHGNPLVIPAHEQHYRGRIITDDSGRYEFTCLRPGNYYDTGWSLWRPAHIHVMIEMNGFDTVVSQLYFADDAHNRLDIPGDDFFLPELALQLAPAVPGARMTQKAIFNFVLNVAN